MVDGKSLCVILLYRESYVESPMAWLIVLYKRGGLLVGYVVDSSQFENPRNNWVFATHRENTGLCDGFGDFH